MVADPDDPEDVLGQWRAGRASELDLYKAVRRAMYQAAGRGVRRMTHEPPDDHAVQEAVSKAFLELWAMDPAEIPSLVGLAATIAYRRGQDQGRKHIKSEIQSRQLTAEVSEQLRFDQLDADAAGRRARQLDDAIDCLSTLTADQRVVIEQTVMGDVPLSDWAHRHGASYEAARRQRKRGLDSVKRCMEHKKRNRESEADGQNGGST